MGFGSINFRKYDALQDPQRDNCGSLTQAVIELGSIKIPLCEDCVKDLIKQFKEFDSSVFCYMCNNWEPSRWGYEYDGKCMKDNRDRNYMDTCSNSNPKQENKND